MDINIRIAKTKEDKKIADNIVIQHHSYVASKKTVGRCIKYIINDGEEDVGTFWIGSGFKPTPKAILIILMFPKNNLILFLIALLTIKGLQWQRAFQTWGHKF